MRQTIDLSSLRTPRNSQHVVARPREVAVIPDIETLLAADAVVAIGMSGGKDSVACALAVARQLDAIGHIGPRILVHSDFGRVEWKDSGRACERFAEHLGWELLTVQRQAGDMLARWEKRWANNVERYRDWSACVSSCRGAHLRCASARLTVTRTVNNDCNPIVRKAQYDACPSYALLYRQQTELVGSGTASLLTLANVCRRLSVDKQ